MKPLFLSFALLLALPAVEAMAGPMATAEPALLPVATQEGNLQRLQRDLKGKSHCRLVYTTFDKRYALVAVGAMTDKKLAPNPWENKKPSEAVAPFVAFYSVDLSSYNSYILGAIEDNEDFALGNQGLVSLFESLSTDNLNLSADGYAFSMTYSVSAVLEMAIIGRVDKPNHLFHGGGRSVPSLSPSGKTYTYADIDIDKLVLASDGYAYYPEYEYDFSGNKIGCTYTLCNDPSRPWLGSDITLPEEVFRGKREAIEAYIESLYGRLSDKLLLKSTGKYSGDALARLGASKKAVVHLERIEDKGETGIYLYTDGGRILVQNAEVTSRGLNLKDCLAQNPKGIDILIEVNSEQGVTAEDGTLVFESADVLYVGGAKSKVTLEGM